MKIYICDHCKKSETGLRTIKVLYKQWSDDKEPREWSDVCQECFVKLETWLGIKREKWMTFYNEKIKAGMEFEEIEKFSK